LQLSSSQRVSSNAAGFSQTRVHSGFTGYHLDQESGNYFTRTRILSVSLGRFLNRNPWFFYRGWGMSGYAALLIDPNSYQALAAKIGSYHGIYDLFEGRMNGYDYVQGMVGSYTEPYSWSILLRPIIKKYAAPVVAAAAVATYVWLTSDPGLDQETRSDGTQIVKVRKCEVAILIGHGDFDRPHQFDFESPTCSGGVFIGCGAGGTNAKIPEGNRLEGAPTWDDSILSLDEGYVKTLAEFMRPGGPGWDKAKEICKEDCCDEVIIRYGYAPGGDLLNDNVMKPALPGPTTVTCGD